MSTAIQLARLTEGYDGANTGNGTKWQEVYFAYQNRRVLQAEVRGHISPRMATQRCPASKYSSAL